MIKLNDSEIILIQSQSKIVSENMIKYGGSFVRNIGEALRHADGFNVIKVYTAWPDYWNKYFKMGEQE